MGIIGHKTLMRSPSSNNGQMAYVGFHPFGSTRSIFTAETLNSGIIAIGSSAAMVSSLTEASGKWNPAYTIPAGTRSDTQAVT